MSTKSWQLAASALLPTAPRLLPPWALWLLAPWPVQPLLELAPDPAPALPVLVVPRLHPWPKKMATAAEAAAAVTVPLHQLVTLPLSRCPRLLPWLLLVAWWLLPGCRWYKWSISSIERGWQENWICWLCITIPIYDCPGMYRLFFRWYQGSLTVLFYISLCEFGSSYIVESN